MDKKQAVRALGFTADLLELLGENEFRVSAYRRAERVLERFSGDWDAAVAVRFKGVPGVGVQLGSALSAYAESGEFGPLEEAAASVPPGVLELFAVRGLGPKKIRALWLAGVTSLPALLEAARSGALADLKGFGATTQARLLEEAAFALRSRERRHAWAAERALAGLRRALDGVATRLALAGSARRGFETLGDVDAVAVGDHAAIRAALAGLGPADHPEFPGVLRLEVDSVPVELALAEPEGFGASLAVMTGSKAFLSDVLLPRARERGLDLSSRGLYDGYSLVPTPEEADLFAALGLPFTIPEWREPEHAGASGLPDPADLVRLEDVRGLLHVHSTWSDGLDTIPRLAEAAAATGMEYLGVCDHSQLAAYAGGLTPTRVRDQWREIEAVNGSQGAVKVLKGIECDIHADGRLDYDDDLLAGFDFVVASVHSSFGLSAAEQTERLVRAVSHPLVTILGHPTGRLLLRRRGYRLDLGAVLEAAEAAGTVVEINANPYRLDLDWREALARRNTGLRFAVNTDAHGVDGFADLGFGVAAARKAGLTAGQVVNTRGAGAFLELARRGRP